MRVISSRRTPRLVRARSRTTTTRNLRTRPSRNIWRAIPRPVVASPTRSALICPTRRCAPRRRNARRPTRSTGSSARACSTGSPKRKSIPSRAAACGAPRTRRPENSTGPPSCSARTPQRAQRLLAWKDTDPAAAMAYWQSLTQATQSMIAATGPGVSFKQFADQYFAAGGAATTEAVLEARRYLEAFGEDTFFDWVWGLDPAGRQRQLILGDQQLGAVFDRKSRERLGLPDSPQPSDDQFVASAQTVRKQTEALATAIDQLTGSVDDSNAVAEIGQLYTAIMTDVQSLQQFAGQDQERLRNAAGADSAGASLGTAIAVYTEAPDEENLATLRTATEAFFAWTAVLA